MHFCITFAFVYKNKLKSNRLKMNRYIILGIGALLLLVSGIQLYKVYTTPAVIVNTNEGTPILVDPDVVLSQIARDDQFPVSMPFFKEEGSIYFLDNKQTPKDTLPMEVADSDGQRELGLMWRKTVKDTAMLFIFDGLQEGGEDRGFWMKNCFTSIDIVFVGADKKILKIHQNAIPMTNKPLPAGDEYPHYGSAEAYQYVVELPASYASRHGIKEGDFINYTRK